MTEPVDSAGAFAPPKGDEALGEQRESVLAARLLQGMAFVTLLYAAALSLCYGCSSAVSAVMVGALPANSPLLADAQVGPAMVVVQFISLGLTMIGLPLCIVAMGRPSMAKGALGCFALGQLLCELLSTGAVMFSGDAYSLMSTLCASAVFLVWPGMLMGALVVLPKVE